MKKNSLLFTLCLSGILFSGTLYAGSPDNSSAGHMSVPSSDVMEELPSVIPAPVEMTLSQGHFSVNSETPVIFPKSFRTGAEVFAGQIDEYAGISLQLREGRRPSDNAINFIISSRKEYAGNDEKYSLKITGDRITVTAGDEKGLFWGAQTLVQLLFKEEIGGNARVRCLDIVDWPRYEWRGYMHDVSRTFYSTDIMKKYIDAMSLYKMNVLHLHLTDDQGWRIEIRKYPELTAPLSTEFPDRFGEPSCRSGYYTQEDIRELVSYAAARNVTIVPEIDVPGHSWAALLARPELGVNNCREPAYVLPFLTTWSHWGVQFAPNTLDPTKQETYDFLDDVFMEIAELFPSEYIHFGGDEAKHYIWEQEPHVRVFMLENGMSSTADLQSYFVSRVCEIIRSKGKKPIGWNDILRDSDKLTKETAIMSWLGSDPVREAAEGGHKTVAVPADLMYLDVSQADRNDGTMTDLAYEMTNSIERIYAYDPAAGLTPEEEKYLLGVQANIWTHVAREVKDVNVQLFPRLLAVAEVGWTPAEIKDSAGFMKRVGNSLGMLDRMKIDYYRPGGYIAGRWNLEGMRRTVLEWDVTDKVYADGRITAGFWYLGGGSYLEIEEVSLLKDGRVISSDRHEGLADTFRATHKAKTYLYSLEEPDYDPEAVYTVQAKVSTGKNGPSYGNFTFNLSPSVPFSTIGKTTSAASAGSVSDLMCEMLSDPESVDGLPRLHWKIRGAQRNILQIGYRILVASSPELLAAGKGDLWDSGHVKSGESVLIPYGGTQLKSRQECFWKVQVETNKGTLPWSDPAKWRMGLLDEKDWKADWIGINRSFEWDAPKARHTRLSARWLRKEFSSAKPLKKATAYVSGLGLYKLYINGDVIGNAELAPLPTDYSKSVFYNTFDVTKNIHTGNNAVGVVLGNGRFFSMRIRENYYAPGEHWLYNVKNFGFPRMIFQLEMEYEDGTKEMVVSDRSWMCTADGPIRANNEFDGEEYDARKEMPGWAEVNFDDGKWFSADIVEAPGGRLKAQMSSPIEVTEVIVPKSVMELKPKVDIVDMGQNMVGKLQIRVCGNAGDVIRLRFAEKLNDDGSIYLDNIREADVTDVYVLKGGGEEVWEPDFTYHGFRYVEVSGFPGRCSVDNFRGKVLHDKMEMTGSFETSDSTLNRIYRNAVWGIRGNYRGMPTDCPQRDERMGWLGDRATGSLGESYIFAIRNLYAKWLDDIEESQRPDGSLSDIAPNYWDSYTNNVTWPAAYIMIAEMLYRQYGDTMPYEKHYVSMKKWMDNIMSCNIRNGIVTHDQFGDWCMPPDRPEDVDNPSPDRITDGRILGTAYYHHLCRLMSGFAERMGKPEDSAEFSSRADSIRKSFNDAFFNEDLNCYGNNTVTANIVALQCGLVPEELEDRVFANVVYKTETESGCHVTTGLIGIQWLMRTLSDYGRADIALKMAMTKEYPGWGYMIENGATTIWELWNGNKGNPAMNSMNHVMLLGDLIPWYYRYLAGIRNDESSCGFKKMVFKPYPLSPLKYVRASYETPYGLAESSWELCGNRFSWRVEVPVNTTATIMVPAADEASVTENGTIPMESRGLKFIGMQDGYAIFTALSGKYDFVSERAFVSSMTVERMSCDHMLSPNCVNMSKPRMSWTLKASDPSEYGQRQTAYMLEVFVVSPDGSEAPCWNSGWVESSETQLIPYDGERLASDCTYRWRVKIRDEKGAESSWSRKESWATGLLEASDWTASWIGSDEIFDTKIEPDCNISDPWFRKTVVLDEKPDRAVMFVSSVGYHELYVNGVKIGDGILAPAVTDNSKRARYLAYDIAGALKEGENVIGIWAGASWSVYAGYKTDDKPQTPLVRAQADLKYADGRRDVRIVTDSSWLTHASPNKLLGKWGMGSMGGELWDARKEIPDWNLDSCDLSGWKNSVVYTPDMIMTAQNTWQNKTDDPIVPVAVEDMGDGVFRVDMGTNFAGWIEVDVKGTPGDRIDFLYSEREYLEMTFRNYSAYIIGESGKGTFRNRFNYGSGRWITIKGLREKPELSDIRGWQVRTAHPETTEFSCSDDLQNWIYDRILWTFDNLSIGGYIVDCPQRERLGYGDAAYISCETGMFNYDLGSLYTKWMLDWRDVQGRDSNMKPRIGGGILPHSAPTYDGGGGPGWGGCTITVPWLVYSHYNDRKILEDNFEMISLWLDFLDSKTENGILKRWGGPWDYLADWLWPGATAEGMNNDKPQAECFNTCLYAFNLATAAKIADVIGREDMAALWSRRAAEVRKAVHEKYFNPDDYSYSDRSMGNLAIALLGEVPPVELRGKVMERLEREIMVNCNGHIDVGIIGGGLLFHLLREEGRDDLIYSMVSQTDYPGWGNMRAHGATTLWEMWEPDLPNHSLCHGSYLYPGAWYIDGLAGIKRHPEAPGFRKFIVKSPQLDSRQISWASAEYESPVGKIKSSWKRKNGIFVHEILVPANASAIIYIPYTAGNKVVESSGCAVYSGEEQGYRKYEAGAGYYRFEVL